MTAWQPAGRQSASAGPPPPSLPPHAGGEEPEPGWPVWLLQWSGAHHRYGAGLFDVVEDVGLAGGWDPWPTADWWCYATGPDLPGLPPGPPPGQPK